MKLILIYMKIFARIIDQFIYIIFKTQNVNYNFKNIF